MSYDSLRGSAILDTLLRGDRHQQVVNELLSRCAAADLLSRDHGLRFGDSRLSLWSELGDRNRTGRLDDLIGDEGVRRINMLAQLANNQISLNTSYAEVIPKVMSNGLYPRDFDRPRRIEELFDMDSITLDNILRSYSLHSAITPGSFRSPQHSLLQISYGNSSSFNLSRVDKLAILLEYLGIGLENEFSRHRDRNLGSSFGLGGSLGLADLSRNRFISDGSLSRGGIYGRRELGM